MPDPLVAKAQILAALHQRGRPLVLPNAWDIPSALVLAAHPRCAAIGTSSAGVAAARGHLDGERMPRAQMIAEIGLIAAAVDLPVTADVESGYGPAIENVEATISGVLEAGAVGANLEDWDHARGRLFDLDLAVQRVRAARATADRRGVPLVLNARTDVFLEGVGEAADRPALALERARRYLDAGGDCIFVPGLTDPEQIAALAEAVPLSVLASAAGPSPSELRELGVVRVSVGSGPMRAVLAHLRRLAGEYLDDGDHTNITAPELPYAELLALMGRDG